MIRLVAISESCHFNFASLNFGRNFLIFLFSRDFWTKIGIIIYEVLGNFYFQSAFNFQMKILNSSK